MRFNLLSDARPRSIAKDLSALASETGIKLSLTTSHKVVATMLGYDNWKHMLSEVGAPGRPGPEDSELTADDRSSRHAAQIKALDDVGIPKELQSGFLDRLRPTSRSDAAAPPARSLSGRPRNSFEYHPERVANAWFRLQEHCENNDRDFEGYFTDAMDIMKEWADGRHLSDLDRILLDDVGENTTSALDAMLTDPSRWGVIVDASAMSNLDSEALLDDTFPHFPKNMETAALYVHLGRNAFPSPYRDVGVEGVYLEMNVKETLDGPGSGFSIAASVVCSEPSYPDRYTSRDVSVNLPLYFRDQLRNGGTQFYSRGEDENLESEIESAKGRDSDPEDSAWAPFIGGPIRAALNAVHLMYGRAVPVHDVVPRLTAAEKAQLERTTTDAQFLKAAARLGEERLCIRALGDLANIALAAPKRNRMAPFPVDVRNAAEINIAIDDSFDQVSPEDAAMIMRPVADAAYARRNDSDTDRLAWIRSCAALLQAELHSEQMDRAFASADTLVEISRSDEAATPYLPIAWLAYELGGETERAARIEELLDADEYEISIEAVRRVRALIGGPNNVGNFLENGAQRPFTVQWIESNLPYGKGGLNYSEEFHYGHYSMHEVQMVREEILADRAMTRR